MRFCPLICIAHWQGAMGAGENGEIKTGSASGAPTTNHTEHPVGAPLGTPHRLPFFKGELSPKATEGFAFSAKFFGRAQQAEPLRRTTRNIR